MSCLNRPTAIGERTELKPQANSTACGLLLPASAIEASAFPMQHAHQREQPARGVENDRDLVLDGVLQDARTLVVQTTAGHVDRLDARRRRGADRRVIAVADQEVVLNDTLEGREREQMRDHRLAVLSTDVEDQAVVLQSNRERIGPAFVTDGGERI